MSANCRLSVELLSLLPRPPRDGVYFSILIHLVSKKKNQQTRVAEMVQFLQKAR